MSSNLLAFGIPAGPEMIFIFVIVLLLFGAKKLPQLARGVGKSAGEFKKAKAEFENEIKSAADEAERDAIEAQPKEDASPKVTNPKVADSVETKDTPAEADTDSAS
jgi:sec-independent protein translocase protein TatA